MLLIQRTLFFSVPLSNAGHTTAPNSDGAIIYLRQPGQLHHDTKHSYTFLDFAKMQHFDTDGINPLGVSSKQPPRQILK